jgi:parvulin-like peptidyl-prolyl isomerase
MIVRRLAPLLALLLAVTVGCSTVGESAAATINGSEISADAVQAELGTIRMNTQYRQAVEQQYQVNLAGTGTGTFSSAFTAQVLSLQIYYRLFEQKMDELGLSVTASEERSSVANVRQQLKSLQGKKFPDRYVKQLAHQDALVNKLQESAATGRIGKDYFAKNKDQFKQACASHILISTDKRSDAEAKRMADDIEAQLAGGADFAALAKASSDDPGSKDAGGDLGCNAAGAFVPAFDKAVFSQPIGKVGPPVKTRFGYHIIVVRERSQASQDDVASQIGQRAFEAFVVDLTCGSSTKVSVNPRFGRWDRSPCKDGAFARVVAPKAPAVDKS